MAKSGDKDTSDGLRELRDSYGSLLDYYFDRPASKETITVGLRAGDIPSAEQAESLKTQIRDALESQAIIEKLTPEERQRMEEAAHTSRLKRHENKKRSDTGNRS